MNAHGSIVAFSSALGVRRGGDEAGNETFLQRELFLGHWTHVFVPFRLDAVHARDRGDDVGVFVAEAVEKRCVVHHLVVAISH